VATTRAESAEAARHRFGATHAFTDAASLAAHPDVDLVVVTVKVPAHVDLVRTALDAGKHVYCEWPLTTTAAEAAELAAAAEQAGVHAVVGLQARFAPAVEQARRLIADGSIGTVLSATLYSSRNKGSARDVPAWTAYTYDRAAGAGLMEVLGGHALDLLQHLVGPVRDLAARTAVRSPEHRVAETGEAITVTSPDQFLATAELIDGAVASIHLHDAEVACPRTRLEIAGTAGDLALVSAPERDPWAAQLQIGRLQLYVSHPGEGAWRELPPDDTAATGVPTAAANVARLYWRLGGDLRDGGDGVPDFATAHALHALIERVA
jgi:predicted dehydrogenase